MEVHDHISSLNSNKMSWKLKVRLTRTWVLRSKITGAVISHHMILLDCLDTHIHAAVKPEIWTKYENILFEGGLYLITNFYVRDAVGNYNPVTNSNSIHLIPTTVITLVEHDNLMIPFHKFELRPLGDLRGIVFANRSEPFYVQSADVIGVLQDLQPIRTIRTCDGDREVINFIVNDGSESIGVSYFGPLNDETRCLYADNLERPVVIVLANFKPSECQGIVRLSNIPSSKIYVNLDAEDVSSFRNRLVEIGL